MDNQVQIVGKQVRIRSILINGSPLCIQVSRQQPDQPRGLKMLSTPKSAVVAGDRVVVTDDSGTTATFDFTGKRTG